MGIECRWNLVEIAVIERKIFIGPNLLVERQLGGSQRADRTLPQAAVAARKNRFPRIKWNCIAMGVVQRFSVLSNGQRSVSAVQYRRSGMYKF